MRPCALQWLSAPAGPQICSSSVLSFSLSSDCRILVSKREEVACLTVNLFQFQAVRGHKESKNGLLAVIFVLIRVGFLPGPYRFGATGSDILTVWRAAIGRFWKDYTSFFFVTIRRRFEQDGKFLFGFGEKPPSLVLPFNPKYVICASEKQQYTQSNLII